MEVQTKMKLKGRSFILLLFPLIGLLSCSRDANIYFQYAHIPKEGWSKDYVLNFQPHISDQKAYNLNIELRHNNDYPYQNIYFFVSTIYKDTILSTDTIQYLLADDFGKWNGSGYNALYQQSLLYKGNYIFPDTGDYRINIRQAMRDFVLLGVEDVGFRIEEVEY